MANLFDSLLQGGPHALVEVRASLDEAFDANKDFFSILDEHHDYLKESIDVLMDPDSSTSDKQTQLIRFFRLLEMHGKAEQETLYVHLKDSAKKEARLEGYSGQDEHDIAFQLEDELLQMGYLNNWNEEIAAKAKVAAGLVQNHIKEEENTMFDIAQQNMDEIELQNLRDAYLLKCKTYLDESNPLTEAIRAAKSRDESSFQL